MLGYVGADESAKRLFVLSSFAQGSTGTTCLLSGFEEVLGGEFRGAFLLSSIKGVYLRS